MILRFYYYLNYFSAARQGSTEVTILRILVTCQTKCGF